MANYLRVPHSQTHITWRHGMTVDKKGDALDLVLRNPDGTPIAKAKLTAEQLHAYICTNNTMKK